MASPKETLAQIDKDFGKLLRRYATTTGSVQGQLHCERLLPGPIAGSAQRLRNLCKVGPEALVLFTEDQAPCHVGDTDKTAKVTGLQERRQQVLKDARLLRHLYPLNGTASLCVNDMLRDVLRTDFYEKLRAASMRARDFSRRPSQDLRGNGRIAFTRKGYHRSPAKYLVAKAWAEVIAELPTARLLGLSRLI